MMPWLMYHMILQNKTKLSFVTVMLSTEKPKIVQFSESFRFRESKLLVLLSIIYMFFIVWSRTKTCTICDYMWDLSWFRQLQLYKCCNIVHILKRLVSFYLCMIQFKISIYNSEHCELKINQMVTSQHLLGIYVKLRSF